MKVEIIRKVKFGTNFTNYLKVKSVVLTVGVPKLEISFTSEESTHVPLAHDDEIRITEEPA